MHRWILAVSAVLMMATSAAADAILTVVSGDSGEVLASYELEDLDAFPQVTFETGNPFVDGTVQYSGPLMRDVLQSVRTPVDGTAVLELTALNDYSIEFPVADAINYDVILATRADGEVMSVRNKGPVWVMYPLDQNPELASEDYQGRLIWQLARIELP